MEPIHSHYSERKEEQVLAEKAIRSALANERQFDPWERFYLIGAVQLFGQGLYAVASRYTEWATTPIAERNGTSAEISKASYEAVGIHTLRRTFDDVAAWPLQQAPDLSQRVAFQFQPET
jgi:hypothetical protein